MNAIESGRKGENYILSGEFLSLQELSAMISKLSGAKIPGNVPVSLARIACLSFSFTRQLQKRNLYIHPSLLTFWSIPG